MSAAQNPASSLVVDGQTLNALLARREHLLTYETELRRAGLRPSVLLDEIIDLAAVEAAYGHPRSAYFYVKECGRLAGPAPVKDMVLRLRDRGLLTEQMSADGRRRHFTATQRLLDLCVLRLSERAPA